MRKALIIFVFLIVTSNVLAQGIFTDKGKFSLDVGVGLIHNDEFTTLAINVSGSVLGIIDIGASYLKASPPNLFNNAEGNSVYLDFYVKKDTYYGIVLNTAFSTLDDESAFLAGLSCYGRFIQTDGFPFNIFPYFSVGYVTTEDIVGGVGLALESKITNNFSIVFTPAINVSDDPQYILGLEFILTN